MGAASMSTLPNSIIRLVPPSLRAGYCPSTWTEFGSTVMEGTTAEFTSDKGSTFYNFGSTAPYPPATTPEPPAGPCGDCGAQDMLVDWTSSGGEDLNELIVLRFIPDFTSLEYQTEVTCLSYNCTSNSALLHVADNDFVETIAFPNLVTANQILIQDCNGLLSVDLSSLVSATGTTIQSYWFWEADYGILIDSPNVTTITLGSSFTPTNGKLYVFDTFALTQANQDAILCIFAAAVTYTSGTLTVYGDGPPSAAGLACKATIQARGVTVNTA
jgi:hypothetical protein